MTSSPSRYTSTVRVDTGDYCRSEENDVTGISVTSSRNSQLSVRGYLVSSPVSPGQSEVLLYLSTPEDAEYSPGLFNGREVAAHGEYINNNHHHQQSKVTSRTSRAVSVPASLHRDLDLGDEGEGEGEGHRRHYSSDVKLTLQPTRESCFVLSLSSSFIIIIHHHHHQQQQQHQQHCVFLVASTQHKRQVRNKFATSPSTGKLRGNVCRPNGFWA